jgi:hypothetical protein
MAVMIRVEVLCVVVRYRRFTGPRYLPTALTTDLILRHTGLASVFSSKFTSFLEILSVLFCFQFCLRYCNIRSIFSEIHLSFVFRVLIVLTECAGQDSSSDVTFVNEIDLVTKITKTEQCTMISTIKALSICNERDIPVKLVYQLTGAG